MRRVGLQDLRFALRLSGFGAQRLSSQQEISAAFREACELATAARPFLFLRREIPGISPRQISSYLVAGESGVAPACTVRGSVQNGSAKGLMLMTVNSR